MLYTVSFFRFRLFGHIQEHEFVTPIHPTPDPGHRAQS
nr:MAG TPA: hypothetical protein [Siphoviridae sp. ctX8T1]